MAPREIGLLSFNLASVMLLGEFSPTNVPEVVASLCYTESIPMSNAPEGDVITADADHQPNVPQLGKPPVWLAPLLVIVSVGLGFAAVYIVGAFQRFYYPPMHDQLGDPPWYIEAVRKSMLANDAIAFSLAGGLVVGVIGLLSGLARSPGKAAIGLLAGVCLGAGAGGVGGPIGYYIQDMLQQKDMDTALKTSAIWATPFLLIGLAGGAVTAMALLRGAVVPAISWGLGLGAAMMLAYILVATMLFPMSRPEYVYPGEESEFGIRLTAFVCWSLAAGLVPAVMALRTKS
ncbi:MAG TPA: hypothetical protein DDW52_21475 [Planctomycetaceae bacterium]|nr:hypothetical protein [Planctomycetaceae bacterium]